MIASPEEAIRYLKVVVLKVTEFAAETYKGLAWKSQWSVGGLRMVSYMDN